MWSTRDATGCVGARHRCDAAHGKIAASAPRVPPMDAAGSVDDAHRVTAIESARRLVAAASD